MDTLIEQLRFERELRKHMRRLDKELMPKVARPKGHRHVLISNPQGSAFSKGGLTNWEYVNEGEK